MPLKFNPFTAQFDLTGSGGGGGASYIDGEVAVYGDLSLDAGVAPLNSAWLVRTASGVWPVSRKQAGIYIRTATAGSNRDADYTYAGTMPDVFSDSVFLLYDEASTTRTGQFNLGSVTAGQNRVLTWPDAAGTIARTETFAAPPSIGNTTPSTGAFTTLTAAPTSGSALTLTGGTVTASAPLIDASQTWNNAAVTFTGLAATITNTASATGSLAARLTVGSTNVFEVDARGFTTLRKIATTTEFVNMFIVRRGTTEVFAVRDDGAVNAAVFATPAGGAGHSSMNADGFAVRSTGSFRISSDTTAFSPDVFLRRDAAGVFAQYNAANPQAYRIYSTFTSTTSFERLNIAAQTGGSFIIGTEKGSAGGTARSLELQTDGVTRVTITQGGQFRIAEGTAYQTNNRGVFIFTADGVAAIRDWNSTGAIFLRIGTESSTNLFPALKRSSTVLQARLANDSDFCPLQGQLRIHQNAVAETITATHTLTLFDAAGTAYKVPCVAA